MPKDNRKLDITGVLMYWTSQGTVTYASYSDMDRQQLSEDLRYYLSHNRPCCFVDLKKVTDKIVREGLKVATTP